MSLFIHEKDLNTNGKTTEKEILFSYENIFRFCPSAFAYLIAIVPCIWLLELHQISNTRLSTNQTRTLVTIPRRFEFRTSTTILPLNFDQDLSDSHENIQMKRTIPTSSKKQDLYIEEFLKISEEFMLKVRSSSSMYSIDLL
jgi:hypothetical protein